MSLCKKMKSENYVTCHLSEMEVENENHFVFLHHIYEYKKGLRNLVLHTTNKKSKKRIKERLLRENIHNIIYDIGSKNINVFFGSKTCIEIIKHINKEKLFDFSDEEDFILGTMLGYDRDIQCKRYLEKKNKILKIN